MLGFIFIGGWGNVKKQLVGNVGLHTCPVCHQLTRWDVYKIDKRATVYFVPVYTYASEKVVMCANCHNGAEASDLDIANLRAQGQTAAPGVPAAGGAAQQPPASFRPAPVAPPRQQPRPASPAPATPAHQAAPAGPPLAPAPIQPARIAAAPPGADRHVVTWLRNVRAMLLKYGYFVQDVRWYEKPYDIPCELSATFLQNGTTFVVTLHRKEQFAQRYASALQGDPSVQQATQAGLHLMRVVDKRVLRVHDARGVNAGQLETWAKTVGRYPLPR